MKKVLAFVMALLMATFCFTGAFADFWDSLGGLVSTFGDSDTQEDLDDLEDLYNGLMGLISGEDEEEDSDFPSFDNAFTGKTTTVKLNGKKYKIHQNFKNVMDEYQEYFDEYIKLMNDPDNLGNYMTFYNKYYSLMSHLESISTDKMSKDELAYYNAVLLSISEKLLDAAQ